MSMDFLKGLEKKFDKMEGIGKSAQPPTYWISMGNYVLNYIMSGSFNKGIPQGRVTGLAGPSGSGKSFIAGNIIKNSQADGIWNFVIDSENALDDKFMGDIGVDVNKNYIYRSVTTINQVVQLVSAFIKGYKEENSDNEDAQKVHITIDSLDMLLTDTELAHYNSGDSKGDQGQRSKQIKAMLRTFVQDIKGTNISMIITHQVYQNSDLLNGEGLWIVNPGLKYSLSQIALLTKLKLKDGKEVLGIRMKCESYKTRFAKPFQKVVIEVPYDTGMNPLSGLLEVAVSQGIIRQAGAWYTLISTEQKFQSKKLSEYSEQILKDLELIENKYLDIDDINEEDTDVGPSSKEKKKKNI